MDFEHALPEALGEAAAAREGVLEGDEAADPGHTHGLLGKRSERCVRMGRFQLQGLAGSHRRKTYEYEAREAAAARVLK
jgi:hypothetical protein